MADFASRLRVAKTLLAAFQAAPGYAAIAASECEALSKELEGAEMTTSQIADCMEEISALGLEKSQTCDLLAQLRAKLAPRGAPSAPQWVGRGRAVSAAENVDWVRYLVAACVEVENKRNMYMNPSVICSRQGLNVLSHDIE